MKKILSLLLVLTMLITMVACSELNLDSYKLTIVDSSNLLYEQPSRRYEAGEQVVIKTKILYDADIECYANGKSLGGHKDIETDGKYTHWEFYFEMPAEDVTITFEVKDGFLSYNDTINLSEVDSWLASLDSSNVSEISIENGYIGVAPGTKTEIEYTNNVDEIVRLVSDWKNVTITEVDDDNVAPGGSFRSITFSCKNGTKHSIYLGNGYYEKNNKSYSMSAFPSIAKDQVTRVDFNYGIYNGTQVLMTDVYGYYDCVVWTETIEDLVFPYGNSNRLYAFNNDVKYTLTEAYENELLTLEDLQLVNAGWTYGE